MVKLFEEYNKDNESKEKEYAIIISDLIPFINKKYTDLSKWATNKLNVTPDELKKICVQYLDRPQYWEVVLTISNWRYNRGNRMIDQILSTEIRKKAQSIGIDVHFVNPAAGHTPMGSSKYVIYDVEKNTIEKK
jgi:gentisate 1,2-dioxygenase